MSRRSVLPNRALSFLGVRGLHLALVFLGSTGIARATLAAETTTQLSNDLEANYSTKLHERVLDNRLDVRVSHGIYTLGGTLLSHSPSDHVRLDPNELGPATQGIRKRWLEADGGSFFVRVGDSYATFGRGLVLNIFEDQSVDFDNALDGVNARVSWRGLEGEILSGTNSFSAPELVLTAARFAASLPQSWKLGIQGTWSDYPGGPGGLRLGGDRLYGGLISGGLGSRLDLYGEYALRDQRDALGGPAAYPADPVHPTDRRLVPQGHASYASAALNLGPVQLLGEYKDLLRYDLPAVQGRAWVRPPAAVPQHSTTLMNRATHLPNINFADERGGLAEAYLNLPLRSRLSLAYGRARGRRSGQSAWETSGELETWLGESIALVGRGAETEETVRQGSDLVFLERRTLGGTVTAPIGDRWSLDVTFETQGATESDAATRAYEFPMEYRSHVLGLTVATGRGQSWGVTGEWTNDDRETDETWCWAEWNTRLGDRHQLSLGGGSVRGGQICSGGVCKQVDPFAGGRVELVTTF